MHRITRLISSVIVFVAVSLLIACATRKNNVAVMPADGTRLPSIVPIAPSSFRCLARILAIDSLVAELNIIKILERGSSLFYEIGEGDTIQSRLVLTGKENLQPGAELQLLIEERLKLNSETPEFVARKIY